MKRVFAVLAMMLAVLVLLTGCMTQADIVNRNLRKEADNFNIMRRIVVVNARSDVPVFEMIGKFSISNNDSNELVVTCELENGKYAKHYVYLNEWTLYFVEDLSGANVDNKHYEVNYLPGSTGLVRFTYED